MRTPYEEYSAVSGSVDARYSHSQHQQQQQQSVNQNYSQNSAIPYHARENSLPFSYGQIGKTSTPLRQNRTAANQFGNGYSSDVGSNKYLDFDMDFVGKSRPMATATATAGNASANNNERNYNYNRNNVNSGSETDANMIKTQPRLTSPLLVRKTLASRSPTRTANANTNTISNVYRFETAAGNGINGNGINANYNNYNNNNNSSINNNNNINKMNGSGIGNGYTNGNSIYSGTLRKTPTRNDFEELLRERREKVYNEYRATTHDTYVTSKPPPPEPPQRQYVPIRSSYTNGHAKPTNSKYNFDFEFNLNLDEVDLAAAPPRRAYTMDRSSLQQYRTKDIQVPASQPAAHAVERNYHTISSSSANSIRETATLPYAKTEHERPLLEAAYNRRFQPQQPQQQPQQQDHLLKLQQYTQSHSPQPPQQLHHQQQQQQQRIEEHLYATTTTAYGNGNVAGYGYNSSNNTNSNMKIHANNVNSVATNHNYNNNNNNNSSNTMDYGNRATLGAAQNRIDLSGPIYATTTKQTTTTTTTPNIENININESVTYQRSARNAEPDLTHLEYTLHRNGQASPISPTASSIGTRPETPAFPVTPRTPFGAANTIYNVPIIHHSSPSPQRMDPHPASGQTPETHNYSAETIYNTSHRPRLNSSLSLANSEPQEVAAHLVKFAKDSSKFWYKPNLSREEAISLLLNAAPGTFLVRDSTTYKNAYGLVLRVAQPPPGSAPGKPDELVRHFLIEPTTRGVRLKGCANEPVFTSLSALVYEHSINQLALPCLLRIPEQDVAPPLIEPTPAQKQLLTQGAACNVLWLFSCDTESLTGEEAIRKAVRLLFAQKPLPLPTEVHFKVAQQGITLTDNTRKKFFRKHYAADMISYCAIDPDHRQWVMQETTAEESKTANLGALKKTIFAFVARRSPSSKDNQCHVFCDLAINQPASAIVSFANKTLPTEKQKNFVL